MLQCSWILWLENENSYKHKFTSWVRPLSSTRIGNRPCNSASISLGLHEWNAPLQIKRMWSVHTFPYFVLTILHFPHSPETTVCKLFIIVSYVKQNIHTDIKNLHTYDWREHKLNLSNWVYCGEISESACLSLIWILGKLATYLPSIMGSKSRWTPSELASAPCRISWLVTILSISSMNTIPSDSANCSSTQTIIFDCKCQQE